MTRPSNLNFLYLNARSLLPKIDELRVICGTIKPDVVCIVETWLDGDVTDSEITITDYNINVRRLDRNRRGGGLAFYIKINHV